MTKEQKIKEKAFQILERDGYKGTTIDSIAKTAGVSKTSVHYYFRTKDTLYQLFIEQLCDELLQPVDLPLNRIIFLVHELRSNKKVFFKALEQTKTFPWKMMIKSELQKRVPCIDHKSFWEAI